MPDTILITGSNRGIGLSLVRELLSRGHTVIAACRNAVKAKDLHALESKYAGKLSIVEMDITSDTSVNTAFALVAAKHPALDILVNNAAVFPEEGNETFKEIDIAHFRTAFDTNVLGTVRVMRAFLPLVEKAGNPRIVNISSGAGSVSDKDDSGYFAYSTSKAALNMMTRAAAAEYKERGITIVPLSPGWVKTEMGGPNAEITPEESASSIANTIERLTIKDTSRFLDRDGSEMSTGW